MCGLVGFITSNKEKNFSAILDRMTDAIAHRGPNDRGTYISSFHTNTIGLGHRRLSIIDLSDHSHQPMVESDIVLVFNGEIYNYIELKEELQKHGKAFESSGDTEVVLKAYEVWGERCFEHFNGMWAIAIFDQKSGKVILSRDRFGKKPLYYYIDQEKIVFASEIKAILAYSNVPKKPNFEKIYRYLSTNYRYVDIDEASYFEGIFSVPKSSYMVLQNDLSFSSHSYWSLKENIINFHGKTEKEIIDDFRDIFIDSVKIRLRSDVPVSCMLSGGMDSTSITCIAHKILKTPVLTFSGITGEDKGIYDESEYIDEVVKETTAKHKYILPEPSDLFDTINEMLFYHDEPICTVSWYTLYQIAKEIKKENVPVVLNGHGGDELLGGYWDHYHYNFFDLEISKDFDELDYEQKAWLKNHDRKVNEICQTREYINKLAKNDILEISKFNDYSNCFNTEFIHKHSRPISLDSNFNTMLSKRLFKELFYETVPASLRAEDRNTMASSIESRSPMLDYRLAEFCFSLSNHYKIQNGIGKWILREAMKGILPEKVRTRKDKAGFTAPANQWFRTVNKEQIHALINSEDIREMNIFNIDRINEIFDEHIEGTKNHQMFLWQFINVGLWYKKFWKS
jgi:asparagine synthase (glutamine-hydrolysing)